MEEFEEEDEPPNLHQSPLVTALDSFLEAPKMKKRDLEVKREGRRE